MHMFIRIKDNMIKRFSFALLIFLNSLSCRADVNVFACEPEWAALTKEIGGDKASVFTALTASQDPHYIRAKPSLFAAIRRAQLAICSGASLEVGWLPLLLDKGSSSELQPSGNGLLYASNFVKTLDKPSNLDRANGDIHPEGNPHLHLDPRNISLVAVELSKRLTAIDPENSSYYSNRLSDFMRRWENAIRGWETKAKQLQGMKVITHHSTFNYLLNWLGVVQLGTLEPKPGIPPTLSQLELLLNQTARLQPSLVIRTPFDPSDASEWFAKKTGIEAVILPYTVGGNEDSKDLFSLFNNTLDILISHHG